jgi:hypothetical protein
MDSTDQPGERQPGPDPASEDEYLDEDDIPKILTDL